MPKKLKIGFVLDDTLDTPDGVQQYVLTVGKWLQEQGHEVHYLVGQTVRKDIDNVHSMAKNLRVRFNQNVLSIPLPSNKKDIRLKLQDLQLDVLHVQMPYSPLFAGRVIKAANPSVTVVGTFHIVPASWLEKTGARTLQLITKQTLRRFDHIVSVSTAAQQFASTIFGIQSTVIPNAVDIKQFKHTAIKHTPLHIVFLGRLVERKGCIWLLEALKQLQTLTNAPYEVTIAGKGPLSTTLHQYVVSQKINNVRFAGFVDEKDKPRLLASADIAVFPSTGGESFGIVLIEAMAAGSRVVIGGDNVGYRSVLGEYPDLLVNPKKTDVFANKLAYFLESRQHRIDARKWAINAITQYDVSVVGAALLDVYKHKQ